MSKRRFVLMLTHPTGLVMVVLGDVREVLGWQLSDLVGERLVDTIIPERFVEAHERGIAAFTNDSPVVGQRRLLPMRLPEGHPEGPERDIYVTILGKDDYTGCFFAWVERVD